MYRPLHISPGIGRFCGVGQRNFFTVVLLSLRKMKVLAFTAITLLCSVHYSEAFAFLCYEQDAGGDRSVTFCANSCFSVGGSVAGVSTVKKGCTDKTYESKCQSVGLPGAFSGLLNEHTCFCNYILCNGSAMNSAVLVLVLLPYLLQKLL